MSQTTHPLLSLLRGELDAEPGLTRRMVLQAMGAVLLLSVSSPSRAVSRSSGVVAVRVWPAREYTRITIESTSNLVFNQFMVENPDRLVVDMQGISFNSVLSSLPNKISTDDPYIKGLRTGRYTSDTVRLVVDLKSRVNPQVFTLEPAGDYGHRLVIDLFPLHSEDLLAQWAQEPTVPVTPQGRPDPLTGPPLEREREREAFQGSNPPNFNGSDSYAERSPTEKNNGDKLSSNDKTARKNEAGKASADNSMKRLVTVAIDPGHGGEDPGAVGAAGTYEKTVTLIVANKLKQMVDEQPGMHAVLTRDSDYFVPLGERVNKARRARADLLISIHADAFMRPDARGSSVFALSTKSASSTAARWLARTQNESDLIGGVKLSPSKDPTLAHILLDLTQTATMNDSLRVAKAVLKELGQVNRLHKNDVEKAGFAVLKAPDVPSILVETAFISNPEEEKRLTNEAYQEKLAGAMLSGIKHYFNKNPPLARMKVAALDP